MSTIFETERLIIREWTESPADLDRIFGIYSREEVTRWLGMAKPMTEPEQASKAVARWGERYGTPWGLWAIEVRETGLVAGSVLLQHLPESAEVEVGWHLHPDSWGNGYATESARGAVQHGFEQGLDEVYAIAYADNAPSLAVMRRLGMTYLGPTDRWYGNTFECYRIMAPGH